MTCHVIDAFIFIAYPPTSPIIERIIAVCCIFVACFVLTLMHVIYVTRYPRAKGVSAKIECIFGTNIYIFCAY